MRGSSQLPASHPQLDGGGLVTAGHILQSPWTIHSFSHGSTKFQSSRLWTVSRVRGNQILSGIFLLECCQRLHARSGSARHSGKPAPEAVKQQLPQLHTRLLGQRCLCRARSTDGINHRSSDRWSPTKRTRHPMDQYLVSFRSQASIRGNRQAL